MRRHMLQRGRVLRQGWARGPNTGGRTGYGGRALRLGQTWEVAAWEIAHFGSFHLENCHLGSRPWENT